MHMHEARSRKTCHIQEEVTQWTLVRSAKARGRTARAKGKESKDNTTRTRAKTSTKTQSHVGTLESGVAIRRIVGTRRTRPTKVVRKERERTRAQRMLTISTNVVIMFAPRGTFVCSNGCKRETFASRRARRTSGRATHDEPVMGYEFRDGRTSLASEAR